MVSDLVVVTTDNVHNYYKVEWSVENNIIVVVEEGLTTCYPLENIVRYMFSRGEDV